jgi:DNA-binding MarR family transcriptional regulator
MKIYASIFLIVLLFGVVSAGNHLGVTYSLIGDKALVEINFGEVNNLEFKLPYDIKTFESNTNYEIVDFNDYKILKVNYSGDLSINYITRSVIDKSSNRNYFILNNNFANPINFVLSLPEGAVLEDLMFPNPDVITTDGRNIILKWDNFDAEEIVVSYDNIKEPNNLWFYLAIVLIIAFSIFYVYQAKNIKRKIIQIKSKVQRSNEDKKKDVIRNLFREEKKIVEYLFDKKGHSCWTKEMVRDLDISKVRLSRKLRNLVQKGLVEKVPYGNENKIKLLKTH